jgi:hypothetical protein
VRDRITPALDDDHSSALRRARRSLSPGGGSSLSSGRLRSRASSNSIAPAGLSARSLGVPKRRSRAWGGRDTSHRVSPLARSLRAGVPCQLLTYRNLEMDSRLARHRRPGDFSLGGGGRRCPPGPGSRTASRRYHPLATIGHARHRGVLSRRCERLATSGLSARGQRRVDQQRALPVADQTRVASPQPPSGWRQA